MESHAKLGPSFTFRSVAVGLLVGTVICAANMYFGLQTGWVSIMSMPASLMGYAVFKLLRPHLRFPFTPVENVLLQSVACGMAIMPLGCGFVGVGRKITKGELDAATKGGFASLVPQKDPSPSEDGIGQAVDSQDNGEDSSSGTDWAYHMRLLLSCFAISGAFTVLNYFFPVLRDLPIFGTVAAQSWLWTLNPSMAYVGQGIIMGTETTLHMVVGAVVGWGILSPLAKYKEEQEDAPDEQQVSDKIVFVGLIASVALCVLTIHLVFGSLVPLYANVIAVLMALVLSVMAF
ncbi:putative oligopeptide transporter [Escovopsis weberi]|uniref:Putative oligopeptide transporter n=1 Tax=Escovopsis weberi TaxID=150374 RepID=A0A0M8N454_ESCWE|nr:putative oligopeptide transporter [Escovopsis weberi]